MTGAPVNRANAFENADTLTNYSTIMICQTEGKNVSAKDPTDCKGKTIMKKFK